MMTNQIATRRKIIRIHEEKCDGCGECISGCPEGAIQLIDGKARLVKENYCDGLGACLGNCPQGAITMEEREAAPYDEQGVMKNLMDQGGHQVKNHLNHLKEHGEFEKFKVALDFLERNPNGSKPLEIKANLGIKAGPVRHGCPGSQSFEIKKLKIEPSHSGKSRSALTHWPIQLHLINPEAPYYKNSELVLAADCVAFALGNFHEDHLAGKTLAIACPKLDHDQEIYFQKLKALIDCAEIRSLTVMIMEVPCCMGLLRLAQQAASAAKKRIPVRSVIVSRCGEVCAEQMH